MHSNLQNLIIRANTILRLVTVRKKDLMHLVNLFFKNRESITLKLYF